MGKLSSILASEIIKMSIVPLIWSNFFRSEFTFKLAITFYQNLAVILLPIGEIASVNFLKI